MHAKRTSAPHRATRPVPTGPATLALAVALALSACGGGGGATDPAAVDTTAGKTDAHPMNGVGSGGTGRTMSIGPVSSTQAMMRIAGARRQVAGSSSITVNGVVYDDSSALVVDDEAGVRQLADLKLGSGVWVQAGAIDNGAAIASAVMLTTDLRGTTDAAYDPVAQVLSVMGQRVVINASTALDAFPAGPSAIPVGSQVEVASMLDPATGNYVATRIDPRANVTSFKARGYVSAPDDKAHTFKLGSQVFDYSGVAQAPKPKAGDAVSVLLQTQRNGAGRWVVTAFLATAAPPADGTPLQLSGVAAPVIDATHYTVAGVQVDATGAKVTPKDAVVTTQSRVEVEGTMSGVTLVADKVTVHAEGDKDGDGPPGPGGGPGGPGPGPGGPGGPGKGKDRAP